AEARVLIRNEGLALNPEWTAGDDRQFLLTQAEVIRSPLTIDRALETVPVTLPDEQTDPIVHVLESLRVSPVAQTNVLTVNVRSPRPEEAVALIRALIASYRQQLKDEEKDTSAEALELLARREDGLRSELARLQDEYEQLHREGPSLGEGRDAYEVHLVQLRRLGEGLAETRLRRTQLEDRLRLVAALRGSESPPADPSLAAAIDEPNAEAGPLQLRRSFKIPAGEPADDATLAQVLSDETVPGGAELATIRGTLQLARGRVQELSKTYGPRHRDRRAAEEQVAYWEGVLRRQVGETAGLLELELEHARAAESDLAAQYEAEERRLKELDNHLLKEQFVLANIERVKESHKATHEQLMRFQLTDAALAEGRSSVTVRVLDDPEPAPALVWPKPVPFLAVCAALGLVAGLLLVCVLENVDPRSRPA
ncbi:MAG: hypothetical protein ACREJB_09550, partial [Planctomycetaceae bacterium]